jgi:REP element-mobilizing transposase RayT
VPDVERTRERRRRIEHLLDLGHGEALLRHPQHAEIVENALLHFDGSRYQLHAWSVMPNHAHVLFTPTPSLSLGKIVSSWKSYTAHQINQMAGREGQLWFEDYFDRFIRSEQHYRNAVAYIEANPVKARLCTRPEDWRWSSAHRRPK